MAKVDKEHAKAELNAWIRERMPGNVSENDKVFGMFKFCLASFIYDKNSGWMESNTHSSNAIRCSPFWSKEIPYADCVRVAYPWTATKDTPEITGLPVDTLYLAEIKTLLVEIAKL